MATGAQTPEARLMVLHTPLSANVIRGILTTKALGHRLELFEQIDSTNREALNLAQADVAHGTVVVAETQTEGRGRLARTWYSPPGINVYCSTVLRKAPPAERMSAWLSWLPLITALAAAEAIESLAGITVGVKWPNDLLIAERKVGGILCESGTSQGLGPFQVVGIGINVNGTRADFPSDLSDTATTIAHEAACTVDRNGLLSRLLHELEVCVEEFFISGYERVSRAYSLRCTT